MMKKYTDEDFINDIQPAYDILWKLYNGETGKGCDYEMGKEQKLLDIINLIDNKLGR